VQGLLQVCVRVSIDRSIDHATLTPPFIVFISQSINQSINQTQVFVSLFSLFSAAVVQQENAVEEG
jgi:hypothetical protein